MKTIRGTLRSQTIQQLVDYSTLVVLLQLEAILLVCSRPWLAEQA
jgi:hypothetical protein